MEMLSTDKNWKWGFKFYSKKFGSSYIHACYLCIKYAEYSSSTGMVLCANKF